MCGKLCESHAIAQKAVEAIRAGDEATAADMHAALVASFVLRRDTVASARRRADEMIAQVPRITITPLENEAEAIRQAIAAWERAADTEAKV